MNGALLAQLLRVLPVLPYVIMGIEQIVKGAKQGAKKKDLALASVGLGSAIAGVVAPEHKAAIEAATETTSALIDGIVATMNAANGKTAAAAASK